jgi:hypothetical protein
MKIYLYNFLKMSQSTYLLKVKIKLEWDYYIEKKINHNSNKQNDEW